MLNWGILDHPNECQALCKLVGSSWEKGTWIPALNLMLNRKILDHPVELGFTKASQVLPGGWAAQMAAPSLIQGS